MPLAHLYVPTHLSEDRVRHLESAVHTALMKTCNVQESNHFAVVMRLPSNSLVIDPHFGHVSRGADASIVEISFLSGRTDDQKRRLYRSVIEQAQQHGWRAADITIALSENALIDWSVGNGVAFADLHTST
jgi:hypothetical protein